MENWTSGRTVSLNINYLLEKTDFRFRFSNAAVDERADFRVSG